MVRGSSILENREGKRFETNPLAIAGKWAETKQT